MKIIYFNRDNLTYKNMVKSGQNFLALFADNWDDYNLKTTLNSTLVIDNKEIELPRIKVLFENQSTTYKFLNNLHIDEWNNSFPIKNYKYVSVPTSLEFYELLIGKIGLEDATKCAESLHDASFMTFIEEDKACINMISKNDFKTSLLRDPSSKIALQDTWKLFKNIDVKISNHELETNIKGNKKIINLKFENSILPQDINILIGPNGSGKSQTIHQLVDKWLIDDNNGIDNQTISNSLNARKLIVVSYSPFELFPVDLKLYKHIINQDIYKYFGFRMRRNTKDSFKDKVNLSRNYPKINAANSLLQCIVDDIKYSAINGWSKKIKTMEEVLFNAIDFDFAAIEINKKVKNEEIYKWMIDSPIFEHKNKKYIIAKESENDDLNTSLISDNIIDKSGVVFFKDNEIINLSSGQRLFSYVVINILGSIKKNSLIVVDEPELFLHPTLEIAFVGMLKRILQNYYSKAILATHSLVTVREAPRKCVHVFKEENGEIFINNPPFETFGGDIQRISSYVFGDKSVSKPYEKWIKDNLIKYGSSEKLIEKLGDDINEEMIVKIHAMEKGKWL